MQTRPKPITNAANRAALPQVSIAEEWDPRPAPRLAVTIAEAARAAGLGTTTIYEMLGNGELEGVRAGRRTLVLWSSLRDFFATAPRYRSTVGRPQPVPSMGEGEPA